MYRHSKSVPQVTVVHSIFHKFENFTVKLFDQNINLVYIDVS